MDPNEALALLKDACIRDATDEIAQHADDLYRWLEKGGAMPKGMDESIRDAFMSMLAILANLDIDLMPESAKAWHVGQLGVAHCTKSVLGGVYYTNAAGGTDELPPGTYRCRLTKVWHDPECGWRMHANLTDPAVVARLKLPSAVIFVNEYTFIPDFKPRKRKS